MMVVQKAKEEITRRLEADARLLKVLQEAEVRWIEQKHELTQQHEQNLANQQFMQMILLNMVRSLDHVQGPQFGPCSSSIQQLSNNYIVLLIDKEVIYCNKGLNKKITEDEHLQKCCWQTIGNFNKKNKD
jgi:hypothetical protein